MASRFTVPGLDPTAGESTARVLQERLAALLDLSLVLKHIHWNVVGPTFIGVHEMLDPQVDAVRLMVDETAERIATLGASPNGLAGNLVTVRTWDDYAVGRATVPEHLAALDLVYAGTVAGHRDAIAQLDELDPVSQDMIITQSGQLEQFQWFVRAHLETREGDLLTTGVSTELAAAAKAAPVAANGTGATEPSAGTTSKRTPAKRAAKAT